MPAASAAVSVRRVLFESTPWREGPARGRRELDVRCKWSHRRAARRVSPAARQNMLVGVLGYYGARRRIQRACDRRRCARTCSSAGFPGSAPARRGAAPDAGPPPRRAGSEERRVRVGALPVLRLPLEVEAQAPSVPCSANAPPDAAQPPKGTCGSRPVDGRLTASTPTCRRLASRRISASSRPYTAPARPARSSPAARSGPRSSRRRPQPRPVRRPPLAGARRCRPRARRTPGPRTHRRPAPRRAIRGPPPPARRPRACGDRPRTPRR